MTIKYADDVVLMAKTEEELLKLLDRLLVREKEYGMEINTEKTKIMIISNDKEPLRIIVKKSEL